MRNIFLLIGIVLCSTMELRAQWNTTEPNVFPDGSFEGAEWLQVLREHNNYSPIKDITRFEQSSTVAKDGRYSLRVWNAPRAMTQSGGSFGFPFRAPDQTFGVMFYVYFPKNAFENPNFPEDRLTLNMLKVQSIGGTVCTEVIFPTSDNRAVNRWIPVTSWAMYDIFISALGIADPRQTITDKDALIFYIDAVDVRLATPIEDNAVIGENDITINPTGGVPFYANSGTISPAPYYRYKWTDQNNETSSNYRGNLVGGQLYTVFIYQYIHPSYNSCTRSAWLRFIPGRPASPTASNATICEGETATLTASGKPATTYHQYAWYDAPTGGNKLGTSATLSRAGLAPGTYKYYVQIDITGDVKGMSSYRVETQVVVKPKPMPGLVVPVASYKTKPTTIRAETHQQGNYGYTYRFYYQNGSNQTYEERLTTTTPMEYIFHDVSGYPLLGTHKIEVIVTSTNGCNETFTYTTEVKDILPLCEATFPVSANNPTDKVSLDKFSGMYVFRRGSDCSVDIPFACIQGKIDSPPLDKVVSAEVVTFSDAWKYDYLATALNNDGAYERGEVGRWRVKSTHAYNKGSVTSDMNYNSGTFQLPAFTWQYPAANGRTGWLKLAEVNRYSPHGDAVEERDALGIASTTKYGYDQALPYLVAQNCDYNSVFFESFEKVYGTNNEFLEDGTSSAGGTRGAISHAGAYGLLLTGPFTTRPFAYSDKLISKGLIASVWVKGNASSATFILGIKSGATTIKEKGFTKVASSGEWSLWQVRVGASDFAAASALSTFQFTITKTGSEVLYIDDVRIQPTDAKMACYVYDPRTLKLLATLDDQHFGLYYQYNMEGKLVRKMLETERGVKTVQETQYNIPEVNKH